MRIITHGAPTIAPQQRIRRNAGIVLVFERKSARVMMPAIIYVMSTIFGLNVTFKGSLRRRLLF
jgi:hypothetical protein